ncbi:hypothetical protein pb186bvf_004491 [Paramecium bursaria]
MFIINNVDFECLENWYIQSFILQLFSNYQIYFSLVQVFSQNNIKLVIFDALQDPDLISQSRLTFQFNNHSFY